MIKHTYIYRNRKSHMFFQHSVAVNNWETRGRFCLASSTYRQKLQSVSTFFFSSIAQRRETFSCFAFPFPPFSI